MGVTGRLPGRLAFTGYGHTSHRRASVTGETWLLAMSFNEIPLVDCHRYAERIAVGLCSVHVVVDDPSPAQIHLMFSF